jgi:hypothetical protein
MWPPNQNPSSIYRRQCWNGCWELETPRLHGVSCESVDWNPYSSIGFARQCGCTILWLSSQIQQLHNEKYLTCSSDISFWHACVCVRHFILTCIWVHNPMIAGQPIFFQPWTVDTIVHLQTKLQNCEPIHLSCFVVDLRERHLGVLDTLFWRSFFGGALSSVSISWEPFLKAQCHWCFPA